MALGELIQLKHHEADDAFIKEEFFGFLSEWAVRLGEHHDLVVLYEIINLLRDGNGLFSVALLHHTFVETVEAIANEAGNLSHFSEAN